MTIRAPYNFVPLSDKVFFPDWANQISHDIPFSDGVSGEIELKIEAKTPIFVRNGHKKEEVDTFSSNYDGRYFIPSTSLKGSIRNVLEIMSFGKIRLDKNSKFAQREWDNKQLYPLKANQRDIYCGWLKQKGNDYVIVDCGKPYRIAHTKIDDYIHSKYKDIDILRSKFCKTNGIDLRKEQTINGKKYDPKAAAYKYQLLPKKYQLENLNFSEDSDFINEFQPRRIKVDAGGSIRGTIVLTGQPDKWVWPRPIVLTRDAGKFYEFVFGTDNCTEIPFNEKEFNHFKFIYTDSTEWDRIKREINSSKGTPVFFRKKGNEIKDLGLAYLYKLPYEKSMFDTLPTDHKENKFDLAECIFGSIKGEFSLKGRVQFRHAFSENAEPDNEMIFTMGSPKASYYPTYIDQSRNGTRGVVTQYKTYNDGVISGWKRYPIRENVWGGKQDYNENLDTKLTPIKKGGIFKSKVAFNNLRRVELGALLSALTFHNTTNCCHQIGQGKPFGLGSLKIDVSVDGIDDMYTVNNNVQKMVNKDVQKTANKDVCFFPVQK